MRCSCPEPTIKKAASLSPMCTNAAAAAAHLLQCLGSLVVAAGSETTIAAGSPGKAPRWLLTARSLRHCLLHCCWPPLAAALLDACCTSRSRAARTQASNPLCGGQVPAPAPSPSPHPLTRASQPCSFAPHPFRCHRCGGWHERHCPCSQSHRRWQAVWGCRCLAPRMDADHSVSSSCSCSCITISTSIPALHRRLPCPGAGGPRPGGRPPQQHHHGRSGQSCRPGCHV